MITKAGKSFITESRVVFTGFAFDAKGLTYEDCQQEAIQWAISRLSDELAALLDKQE